MRAPQNPTCVACSRVIRVLPAHEGRCSICSVLGQRSYAAWTGRLIIHADQTRYLLSGTRMIGPLALSWAAAIEEHLRPEAIAEYVSSEAVPLTADIYDAGRYHLFPDGSVIDLKHERRLNGIWRRKVYGSLEHFHANAPISAAADLEARR